MLKRILSIALISMMLVSTLGMSVSAAEVATTKDGGTSVANPIAAVATTKDGGASVINPIKEYTTFAELQKAVSFKISLPTLLPQGYKASGYATINGDLAQVTYTNDKKDKILYRVAKGDQDISGDYTVFTKESTLTYSDVKVALKGSKTVAKLATWSKDKLTYSLGLENGVKWDSMELIMDDMLKPTK